MSSQAKKFFGEAATPLPLSLSPADAERAEEWDLPRIPQEDFALAATEPRSERTPHPRPSPLWPTSVGLPPSSDSSPASRRGEEWERANRRQLLTKRTLRRELGVPLQKR